MNIEDVMLAANSYYISSAPRRAYQRKAAHDELRAAIEAYGAECARSALERCIDRCREDGFVDQYLGLSESVRRIQVEQSNV